MKANSSTKEKILNTGLQMVLYNGYHNTGLIELIEKADISKGTFYHYFKSKENFALELIDRYTQATLEVMIQGTNNSNVGPLENLKKVFQNKIALQQSLQYKRGCLIGNFSIEMGNLSQDLQLKTEEAHLQLAAIVKSFLDEAQQKGELPEELDIDETANYILNSWQGALLRMKSAKSNKPLKQFFNHTFNILLKKETVE